MFLALNGWEAPAYYLPSASQRLTTGLTMDRPSDLGVEPRADLLQVSLGRPRALRGDHRQAGEDRDQAVRQTNGYGSNLNQQETVSPCFYLPMFNFGYLDWTHTQINGVSECGSSIFTASMLMPQRVRSIAYGAPQSRPFLKDTFQQLGVYEGSPDQTLRVVCITWQRELPRLL